MRRGRAVLARINPEPTPVDMSRAEKHTRKGRTRLFPTFPPCTSCKGAGRFIASGERYSVPCSACGGVGANRPREEREASTRSGAVDETVRP